MVLRYMQGGISLRELEVMDIDEAAFRAGAVSAKLYGYLNVPYLPDLVQGTKAGGVSRDRTALADIAARIAEAIEPGRLYILGPGTTMRAVADKLGVEKTLLGVDLVRDGKRIAADAGERDILAALDGTAAIAVTPIGGQGHFFGRGNQQISDRVVDRIGVERIHIVGSERKMHELMPPWLLVDVGDEAPESPLIGYRRVHTGARQSKIMKVVDATTAT